MILSGRCLNAIAAPVKQNIDYVLEIYKSRLFRWKTGLEIFSETDIAEMHELRYEVNLSLWYYLLGLESKEAIRYEHKTLPRIGIKFSPNLPPGSYVVDIINTMHLICDYEEAALHSLYDLRTCAGYGKYEKETKYLNSICSDAFYADYNAESIIDMTRMFVEPWNAGICPRNFIWELLAPEHFLIWAYMGTNLKVKLHVFGKQDIRPIRPDERI